MKKFQFPKLQKSKTQRETANNYRILKRCFYSIAAIIMGWGCVHALIECIQLEQNTANSAPGWVAFVLCLPLYGMIALFFFSIGLIFRYLAKKQTKIMPQKENIKMKAGDRMMTYGEKIYTLREKNGLSQEELAEKLEVSRQTISNWENDKVKIDIIKAKQLCDIFHISIEEFCSEEVLSNKEETLPYAQQQAPHSTNNKTPKNAKLWKIFAWIVLVVFLLSVICAVIDTIKTGTLTIGSTIQLKTSWWFTAIVGFIACTFLRYLYKK